MILYYILLFFLITLDIIQKGHKVGGVRVVKGSETHEIMAPMIISRNNIILFFASKNARKIFHLRLLERYKNGNCVNVIKSIINFIPRWLIMDVL